MPGTVVDAGKSLEHKIHGLDSSERKMFYSKGMTQQNKGDDQANTRAGVSKS